MAKITQVNSKEYVDTQTGEVIATETEKSISIKSKGETFFFIFYENLSHLLNLTGAEYKVLAYMASNAEFDTGIVTFIRADKKELCRLSNMSIGTIDNAIRTLKGKEFIKSIDRGRFAINPIYFWKGSTNTRSQALKDGIEFTIKFEE